MVKQSPITSICLALHLATFKVCSEKQMKICEVEEATFFLLSTNQRRQARPSLVLFQEWVCHNSNGNHGSKVAADTHMQVEEQVEG